MTHACHATGCKRLVPPKLLFCIEHWRMVPYSLQQEVWATYVPGQEIRKDPTDEYLEVQRRAVEAVERREGRSP